MKKILKLSENKDLVHEAAQWFHEKWDVPVEEYEASMQASIDSDEAVPQWYIVIEDEKIVAGAGVIDNDLHDRKDLTPNICALYVEKARRNESIAANLLQYICDDMADLGISVLYLITDHDSLYEKYGWQFLCMVQGDHDVEQTRLYEHVQ